ncbi:hypothetical protein Tco_1414339 [Tanacetum coccineum]
MGCCLTSWFSKKQTALAISTTESEYVSAGKACQQALWMKQALVDYDINLDDIPVLCDNKGSIGLSKNPVLHSRTKHIEIQHHFLCDNVQKGNIFIEKCAKKETKAMYQIDTEEVSDRFMAPCFVNGLEAYDGEINLGVVENMISNEYAVKLCLEYEVKRENKVVKKELIVALRGKIYFVKFIINPKEDDVEPGMIFDDIPLLGEEGLPPFVCKMGKTSRNKKRAMENLNFFYQDIGTSSLAGGHLTQEEATKEAIASE